MKTLRTHIVCMMAWQLANWKKSFEQASYILGGLEVLPQDILKESVAQNLS